MKNIFKFIPGGVFLILFPVVSFASSAQLGLGDVANNILDPVRVLSDFIHTACFIIGGSFLFASIIKFVEHKRSPTMVPISTVIYLILMGIVLILLPFLSIFTESGVSYNLMNK